MLCLQADVSVTDHHPVMLGEAVRALQLRADGVYVDATYGRGGHSRAILAELGAAGRLLAMDQDPAAETDALRLASVDQRFAFERGRFSELGEVLQRHRLNAVDGILVDLGVSSPQLDEARRGFSFRQSGPLDMRMNPDAGESAAEWLARATHPEIARVLRVYGEEPLASRIASAILRERESSPIIDTAQLARLIEEAVPARLTQGKRVHPATRSFQAIRIHINNELGELESVLPQALAALKPGGRLAVIAFHSLEDRIVKRFLRRHAQPEQPALPMAPPVLPSLHLVGKAQRAAADELESNPRARSAVLRVAEKVNVRPGGESADV